MPAIVATVGGATSNSFVTLVEAEAYMDKRLNAEAWTGESDDDKKARALIGATRELTSRTGWVGYPASSTQALAWPRLWAADPDCAWPGYVYYDGDVIPSRVKDATCELALQLLARGTSDFSGTIPDETNVRVKTVGPLTTEYFEPFNRTTGLAEFPLVLLLIRPLLYSAGSNNAPILRG